MTRTNVFNFCLAFCVLSCAACTRIPELEDKLSVDLRNSDYPTLVPLDQALAPLPLPDAQSEELEQELAARSARLKNRADALNAAGN